MGLWFAALIAGFAALTRYDLTPGSRGAVASDPEGAHSRIPLARSDSSWTLVVFAHPECPCTGATLENVDRLAAENGDRLEVRIVIVPISDSAAGGSGRNVARARELTRAEIVRDDSGSIARSFGVATSGDALLFDPSGRLRFRGGLTDGRGHAGDGIGIASVRRWILGSGVDHVPAETPVFGCPLFDEAAP